MHIARLHTQSQRKSTKGVKEMTRKEMITACIDEQIKRGIVKAESREFQVKAHLKGMGASRPMSVTQCKDWYKAVFNK